MTRDFSSPEPIEPWGLNKRKFEDEKTLAKVSESEVPPSLEFGGSLRHSALVLFCGICGSNF